MIIRDAISHLAEALYCPDPETVHDMVISVYNAQPDLPRGYKLKASDAWCAAFVSALGLMLGISGVVLPECSVPEMVRLYQERGWWMEDDDYIPDKGDLIVYDWGDTGSGDNIGDPDHVGIITARLGSSLVVVEGNIDNHVFMRTLSINDTYIRGYCCPDYGRIGTSTVPTWAKKEFTEAIDAGITDGSRPMDYATRMEAAIMALRAQGDDDDGR